MTPNGFTALPQADLILASSFNAPQDTGARRYKS